MIARKAPPWINSNKSNEQKAQAKPLGPKNRHAPHTRQSPTDFDRQVEVIANKCSKCRGILHPPSHWHSHAQIDLAQVSPTITTEYKIGWSYCLELTLGKIQKLLLEEYQLKISTGE